MKGESLVVEVTAELLPRVVQRLVKSTSAGVQAFGENVDRHAVERERNEDVTLVRRQRALDPAVQRRQELALLGLLLRREPGAREQSPALGFERRLPSLPRASAQLDRRFEQRELVRPGRKSTCATEAIEPGARRAPRRRLPDTRSPRDRRRADAGEPAAGVRPRSAPRGAARRASAPQPPRDPAPRPATTVATHATRDRVRPPAALPRERKVANPRAQAQR
jgi:hypothetical protein